MKETSAVGVPFYESGYHHLGDVLRKLDLLIKRRVTSLRLEQNVLQAKASQSLYISHEEVGGLLAEPLDVSSAEISAIDAELKRLGRDIDVRARASLERGVSLPLLQLARLFGLSSFEVEAVVICLAPELRRKYDRLYAYLQDDITRKRPSVDLALELLCPSEADKWRAKSVFSDHAPLLRAGILHKVDDPQSPSGSSSLAQFLRLDARIYDYLLGHNILDGQLQGFAKILSPLALDEVFVAAAIKTGLLNLIRHHFSERADDQRSLALYLGGPYGVGKKALAQALCQELGCPLLQLDMERLLDHEAELERMLRLAFREGLLLQAAVYLKDADALWKDEGKASALIKKVADVMSEYGWLTFLSGAKPWPLGGSLDGTAFHVVTLPAPDFALRTAAWQISLHRLGADTSWAEELASRFRLTPRQIEEAAQSAVMLCRTRDEAEVSLADLFTACGQQSNPKLAELAVKLQPRYCWHDLILPQDKLAQLQEICDQVKHYHRVFEVWGFERKLAHGKGLSALFSGPPGTGKTMAAEVIAHELHLELYKVDLAGVVSKYIGETEKNLAKVFQEAEATNAVLFFDEADALFGKRTQVSDAHDRYANIETSYLLQKMEAFEGIVILATNLRENMDEAFTRRIRFIVEFPFPDAANREAIWKTHFPPEAPLAPDLDYELLAKRFQIAGGNIKNIVLNAAFFAAEDGEAIGMNHVLRSVKREFEKIGKLWHEGQLVGPAWRT
jgi:SpoVK/Ycf46/Vps4 family AAA+-type ATPase